MVRHVASWSATDRYTALIFAAGAVAFTLAFFIDPIDRLFAVVVVAGLVALSERLNIRLYYEGRVSIGFVGTVVAAVALGLAGTAIVMTTIAFTGGYLFADRSRRKLMFNFGQQNLAGFVAAGLLLPFGVRDHLDHPFIMMAAGVAAGTIIFVITSTAVSMAMALSSGRAFAHVYRSHFGWLFAHYSLLGIVGGGIPVVYSHLGVTGVAILSVPLLLSRYAMKQVVDRTRENVLRLEKSNTELRVAIREISHMSEQLHEAYTGTLESLVAALDMRDQETRGHSGRVAAHSLELAQILGIKDDEELTMIYRGALMHDVGKIGVPDAILRKPGPLTDEEWEFMRRHPALGYRILAQVPYLRPAAKIVLAHHERWDGDGYPRRLKGEDIPLGARIFSLSDTYDAIVSDRPYREGQSPDAAFAEILRCAGTQFDPKVVEAFEAAFPRWREEDLSGTRRPLYLPAWRQGNDETGRAAG